MEYLPTLGETWLHSRGNVGKYTIHGSFGIGTSREKGDNHISNKFLQAPYCYVAMPKQQTEVCLATVVGE